MCGGNGKKICLKSLQRKLFLRFAPFKLNMKLLYTIKIFEFTLTKNGHFGFICLRPEMVMVDYLHLYIKWISLSRLGEAGADPTFHNTCIKCLMLREKGKELIGRGGGSDKIVWTLYLNSFRKGTVEYRKYLNYLSTVDHDRFPLLQQTATIACTGHFTGNT